MITIMAFIVAYLKKEGYLEIVSNEHIHDLGKYMFAFTIFWAYLWLSQYLLIWYAARARGERARGCVRGTGGADRGAGVGSG